MSSGAEDAERTFRPAGFARLILWIYPYFVAVFALVAAVATVGIVVAMFVIEEGSLLARIGAVAFLAVWWLGAVVFVRPMLSMAREVRELRDGALEVDTVRRGTLVVRPGDITEVRHQHFYPQPGAAKVTTADGQRFYVWAFEQQYDLVARLRGLR